MTNAIRLRRRLVLVACVVLLALAAGAWYWVQRPINTWNRFTAALKRGDLALANSLCDQETVKVQSLDAGHVLLAVKSDTVSWMDWPGIGPITLDLFFEAQPVRPPDWPERLGSRVRLGNPGSVWYGHLEVHGGKVEFRSDVPHE